MKELTQPKGVVIPEKIHLLGVNIANAQVNSSISDSAGWDELTLNIGSATLFNEDYLCRLSLMIDMEKPGEDGQPPMIKANFSIDFDFQIENIMELIVVEEGSKTVVNAARQLGISLMGIAYSTARGIILTRTGGTVLNGLILPVVDTAKLLDAPIKK
ncbi:hypothetical protein [Pedobacter duraquae]|uniref:Uncharacterized protein n=1 Tax=Pedobacter duraquae TaxID=425511 RepID=A0A4R6IE42_9SPHI|nr:hypothetical protein [Pedobacter duraquae]TDO20302.1 hypothetical protein CLV32_4062 [Pedobacter duraquae]